MSGLLILIVFIAEIVVEDSSAGINIPGVGFFSNCLLNFEFRILKNGHKKYKFPKSSVCVILKRI